MRFKRSNKVAPAAYFVIDEIEIFRLSTEPQESKTSTISSLASTGQLLTSSESPIDPDTSTKSSTTEQTTESTTTIKSSTEQQTESIVISTTEKTTESSTTKTPEESTMSSTQSTTETTTTTTEKTSTNLVTGIAPMPVFLCNFDGNSTCGGQLFSNNSGFSNAFSIQSQQVIVSTTLTDITSISNRHNNKNVK